MSKNFKMTYYNGRTRIAINVNYEKCIDSVYQLKQYKGKKCTNCKEIFTTGYHHVIVLSTYYKLSKSDYNHKVLLLCEECALKLNLHFRCRKKKDIIKGIVLLKMKGIL